MAEYQGKRFKGSGSAGKANAGTAGAGANAGNNAGFASNQGTRFAAGSGAQASGGHFASASGSAGAASRFAAASSSSLGASTGAGGHFASGANVGAQAAGPRTADSTAASPSAQNTAAFVTDYQRSRSSAASATDSPRPQSSAAPAAHAAGYQHVQNTGAPVAAHQRTQNAGAASAAGYQRTPYSRAAAGERYSSHAAKRGRKQTNGLAKKPRRNILSTLLIVVGLALIAVAAGIFIHAQIGYQEAQSSYEDIVDSYTVTDADGDGVPSIDFDALAAVNSDIVGWIYVPNTVISYPVVQGSDNSKYLNTLFDGTSNSSGAIFLDCDNTAPGMVDEQTTIYGHHMNDASMFNAIAAAADQEEFDKIETVYYITRGATYKLKPLLVKVVDGDFSDARTANFTGDTTLTSYLETMVSGANASADDAYDRISGTTQIMSLVTCRRDLMSNGRAVMILTPEE